MKKVTVSLLLVCLFLSSVLSSCVSQNNQSDISNELSQTQSETVSEEESRTVVEEKSYPHVVGTFIQPYLFADSTQAVWENHFSKLLEAGIDIVIIQWTARTPYAKFMDVYYPSEVAAANKADGYNVKPYCLERCLAAAEKKGIKVFVGLNDSDEWWDGKVVDDKWSQSQGLVGNQIAGEIYDLYKEKYPNTLYGWYFTWEFFNAMKGYEDKAAKFLNYTLDYIDELDPSMPLMLSPFVSNSASDAVSAGEQWTKVFAKANFREGDIYCCQDSVGAGHIKIEELDSYYKELKKACDTKPGLKFWANNENFDQSDWSSADLGRFVKQMNIASKYVEKHVTFAYSHYYSPDRGFTNFHNAYVKYYKTGVLEKYDIAAPEVSYKISGDTVTFTAKAEKSPVGYYKIFLLRGGASVGKKLITTGSETEFTISDSLTGVADGQVINYKVYITDINGNISKISDIAVTK